MKQIYSLNNYKSFTITLYWLNSTTKLTFSIIPMRKTKTGENRLPYSEFVHNNEIYAFMDMRWKLSIDSGIKDEYGINIKYEVEQSSLYQFLQALKTIKAWFTEPVGEKLFIRNSSGKVVANKQEFSSITIRNFYGNTLEFDPTVNTTSLEADYIPGVNLYINGISEPCFMSTINYLNFVTFVENISIPNLVISALSILSTQTLMNTLLYDQQQQNNSIPSQQMKKKDKQSFFSIVGAVKNDD